MAKRRGGRKNKSLKIILGVLGVAVAGVIGYVIYKRTQQPGTSTTGVQVWRA
jgi:flagellar basal body-associated protein FliL